MEKDGVIRDWWLVNQLMGIRMLERELAAQLRERSGKGNERLHKRVVHLKSMVDALDQALSQPAH